MKILRISQMEYASTEVTLETIFNLEFLSCIIIQMVT